ncbi:hypothetical protein [Kitasatospora cheerisanensis]|uniref:Uncharacterized protein n=1 Tax=Kitasatospora cheerisanensis KCTC 2395 TaxID=1348663 RepID=A0A066Z6D2_9ACTN|nr:hypothetical protein [Kitasatospora cheerisanensis]KDN85690.1 hypothetical protein KCH_25180 [Kitasatospora cheerisanensis KCTC 2395]
MTTTATYTLGQYLAAALHQRGIKSTTNGHQSANSSWLEIDLPGGTAIWVSDQDAKIDIDPGGSQGLQATHYLGNPYENPGHFVTVYDAFRDPDTAHADITAAADAIAAYITNWKNSPAARHPDRPIDKYGVMDLPARYLRPGDVTVHTATGAEAVVVTNQRRSHSNQYRRTTRTIAPPTSGGTANLPPTHWQYPFARSSGGAHAITVLAHRHHDPQTLPPIPYPEVPEQFNDGDHVVHDSIIWERTDGTWRNATRSAYAKPTSDETVRRLFTDDNALRLGTPVYLPTR